MYRNPNSLISLVLVSVVCLAFGTVVQAQLPEPVSFWRFEEGSGDTTEDIGTGVNPGTLVGSVAFVKDPERGSVLEFGTGESYVETNAWITELGDADFSIAAWIKTTLDGATIVSKSSMDKSWSNMEKKLYIAGGGGAPTGAVSYVGYACEFLWGDTAVTDNQWYHVCVTWDNDTDDGHIYINGVVDDGTPTWYFNGGTGDNADDRVRIGFGCGGENVTDFEGLMDDLAIFNTSS